MPKKRKTLQHKILADQKRSVPSSSQITAEQEQAMPGVTFSLPTSHGAVQKVTKPYQEAITIATSEYGYLANDLMRTALLTVAIVITELLIRFFIVHS